MAGDNISFGWGCRRGTKVLFWFTQRSDHIQLSGLPFASAFLGFAATDDNEAAILPSLFVILLASLWVFRYALVDDRVSNFEVVRVVDPLLHTTGLGADFVRRGSWLDSGCIGQRCGDRRVFAVNFSRLVVPTQLFAKSGGVAGLKRGPCRSRVPTTHGKRHRLVTKEIVFTCNSSR